MAAQLDGDALDDLIVFARDYSNPSKIDYQEDRVSTFLTVYDSNWNSCSNGTKKPYFPWAPPYPPQAVDLEAPCGATLPVFEVFPEDPDDEPWSLQYNCLPDFKEEAWYEQQAGYLHPGQSKPSDETQPWMDIDGPITGTVGDFYSPDGMGSDGCVDFFVANSGDNATYVRGVCSADNYTFLDPVHIFSIGENPRDIETADLNHDEFVDIVAALSDGINFMYGEAGEFFFGQIPLDNGEGYDNLAPTSLAVEDVNDDGWVDLLVISSNHKSVLVYLNGGVAPEEKLEPPPHETRFLGPYPLSVGDDPIAILVAPIYTKPQADAKDNCNDVAVLNAGSGTITLLRNSHCED